MQPYVPDGLPLTELDYRLLLPLVGQANAALARYDGLLQGIPNPAVMLSPLTTQEAVLSSRIEGTQATVDEVLEQEAGLLKEGEKYKDIQEISNYRHALFKAREYLENHRDEYYQRLKAISAERDWDGWIAFFLRAIIEQAGQNIRRVEAIKTLYDEMKVAIQGTTHSQYSVHLLDAIFSKPIFRTSDLAQQLVADYGIHDKTAPALLRQLRDAGILRELQPGSGRRAATLCFPRLINLAEGRDVI